MAWASTGDDLGSRFREVVGDSHVLVDRATVAPYCSDWTRRFSGTALCVVRPGTTEEVASVVRACAEAGVPLIPQGGNTGLVGGSVPAPEMDPAPVILSTRRLAWMDPVNGVSGQVSVGAGAILGDVQRHAHAAGWEYGVDLGARDSATIGGTVATNAGGIRVLAYGMTRAQVVGIEAVLPDGSVISHMSGLAKDNTGFDLAGLLCGSEGTLAVITAVRLRLHRPHDRTSLALVGCSDFDDALTLVSSAVCGRLMAAEAFDAVGMRMVGDALGLANPLASDHPLYVLLEVADGGTGEGFATEVLADRDVVVGLDASEIERLWQYRERQAEAFATLGVIRKFDITLPLGKMTACAEELRDIVTVFPEVSAFAIFGHIGDGNFHVQIAGSISEEKELESSILECVARFEGSISAEHGIGRAKAAYLSLSRTQEEITAMRSLKKAWDPNNVMNPGVIFAEN